MFCYQQELLVFGGGGGGGGGETLRYVNELSNDGNLIGILSASIVAQTERHTHTLPLAIKEIIF